MVIPLKVSNWKIIKVIRFFIDLNHKYEMTYLSSSISFYMLVSLISSLVIGLQITNTISSGLNDFIIVKVIEIINQDFLKQITDVVSSVNVNTSTIFIFISLIWSSSKVINSFIRASNKIYKEYHNFIYNRSSAVVITIYLLLFLLVEIFVTLFGNYMIVKYFYKIKLIMKILQMFLELISIYVLVLILNIYCVPYKAKIKDVNRGSILSTILIYGSMNIFIIVVDLYNKYNQTAGYLFFITVGNMLLFVANYSLILGFVYNHYLKLPGIN